MELYGSELKVMELIWKQEGIRASQIVKSLKASTGWARNTTYTVISRCVEKGYIRREEPGFQCFSRVSRSEVGQSRVRELLEHFYDGSVFQLFAAFAGTQKLTLEEKEQLKKMIREME